MSILRKYVNLAVGANFFDKFHTERVLWGFSRLVLHNPIENCKLQKRVICLMHVLRTYQCFPPELGGEWGVEGWGGQWDYPQGIKNVCQKS